MAVEVAKPPNLKFDSRATTTYYGVPKDSDIFGPGRDFVDWIMNDSASAAMTANENPLVGVRQQYNAGDSIWYKQFQDWARDNPMKFATLIVTFVVSRDDWLSRVFPVSFLVNSVSVIWNRFIVDREIPGQEVRNTGARIISGYNDSGEMHMVYYAQLVAADRYFLEQAKDKSDLNRLIAAMGYNLLASMKLQTLRQIENTPYDLRTPQDLDPSRRMAKRVKEVFQNRQNKYGMLNKDELGLEHLLTEFSSVLGRRQRELASIIVKREDYDAIKNKSGGRFFFSYSGQKGIADRAGGGPLPTNASRDGSLLGITIHQIPLLDMQNHNNTDGGILTNSVSTGSRMPFLNDTHDCEPHRYTTTMRKIEVPSWETNEFDPYFLHDCIEHDLARFYPLQKCHCSRPGAGFPEEEEEEDVDMGGMQSEKAGEQGEGKEGEQGEAKVLKRTEMGGEHEHGKGGQLNRKILDAFCGPAYSRTREGDYVIQEESAVMKMRAAFKRIKTKLPGDTFRRACIDNALVYHAPRQQWYPAQFVGEVPLELNPTKLLMQSYRTMGREVMKGVSAAERSQLELFISGLGGAADAGVIDKIINNVLRCTHEHVVLSGTKFGGTVDGAARERVRRIILSSRQLFGGENIRLIREFNPEYVEELYTRYGIELPEEGSAPPSFLPEGVDVGKYAPYTEPHFDTLVEKEKLHRLAAHSLLYPLGGEPDEKVLVAMNSSEDDDEPRRVNKEFKLTAFSFRWLETATFTTLEEIIGARFFLTQENCTQTYTKNAKSNIANPFGGFIARPFERQNMHGVVGTCGGVLGTTYVNLMGSQVDYQAEIKHYTIEQGMFTGTVITQTDGITIATNVRGGQVLGGKGRHFATDLLRRKITGQGYGMNDQSTSENDNQLYANPIVDGKDGRIESFGKFYYGHGERLRNNSNFFFFQSANAMRFETYDTDVDLCGYWDRAAFVQTLRHSVDFSEEQENQQWEGCALVNFVYRFKELMVNPYRNVDLDKYSYAQVAAMDQLNTWLHTPTTKIFCRNMHFRMLKATHPWGEELSGLFNKEQSMAPLNPILQV